MAENELLDLVCVICGTDATPHATAERDGAIHHKFSTDGVLVEVKVDRSPGPAPLGKTNQNPPGPLYANMSLPSDPILRFVLIQKGLVTPEELTEAEKTFRATGMLSTTPVVSP